MEIEPVREAGRGDIYSELPRPGGGTILRVFFFFLSFSFFLFDGAGRDGDDRAGG